MSLSLVGKEMRKFDQVNRMSIPPNFRSELGSTVIIMKAIHKEPCLIIFSEAEWEKFSQGVVSAYSGAKQAMAQRRLADRVERLFVDKGGRISIKNDFKEFAGLGEDVLVVGAADRIELWTKENWEIWNPDDGADDEFDFSEVSYSSPGR